jgi:hypothetical protein
MYALCFALPQLSLKAHLDVTASDEAGNSPRLYLSQAHLFDVIATMSAYKAEA